MAAAGTGDAVPLVCFPFVGNLVGGSHISALGLIKRLDPARYRPLVLVQHREGEIADLCRCLVAMGARRPRPR